MSHPYKILDPAMQYAEFRGKCALTVMAKAPQPGKVKTRLAPPLTPAQCAEINACFLRDTVANLGDACAQSMAEWVISYTPVGLEHAFEGVLPAGGMLLPQRGDGFGERLLTTAQDLFACGFSAVCLIDSDSPTVPTSAFIEAANALLNGDDRVVLGVSDDGGYYLIGMSRPHAILFERITWSTASVADETLERAKEAGLDCLLLERWYDVDDAYSLGELREELLGTNSKRIGYAAPHTRRYLEGMYADETSARFAPAGAGVE